MKLKILTWNVAGLRAAARKGLAGFIGEYRPDILCLQEIKARPEQVPEEIARLEDYHLLVNSARRPGYSGTAVLTRRPPVSSGIGFDLEEGRVQVLRYAPFTLVNVYVPNGKSGPERLAWKMDFSERLLELLDAEKKHNGMVLLAGDINTAHREIDLARPRENSRVSGFLPEERAWIDRLLESGFVDTFRLFESGGGHYTWWSQVTRARERNVGWRIDYLFATRRLRPFVKEAFILDRVTGSDHCPAGLELDLPAGRQTRGES